MQFNPYIETWERLRYFLHGVLENPTHMANGWTYGKFSHVQAHTDVTVLVTYHEERELYFYVKQLVQNHLSLTVLFLVL